MISNSAQPADSGVTFAPSTTSTTLANPRGTLPATPTSTTDIAGAVTISPGASIQDAVDANPDGTTFILSPGEYRGQIVSPRNGNVFVGSPGAVLVGDGASAAFIGSGVNGVVIEGLEIRGYEPGHEAAAIRSSDGSRGWTIRENEITDIVGIAVNVATEWQVIGNHLHHNTQYGIRGAGGDILIEGNEISFNNQSGATNPYCCAGGTKFVHVSGLILRNNYVHHNVGPGLWVDGFSTNTLYEGNTVVANTHAGIKHEISCNAVIRDNYAEGNGFGVPHWVEGGGIVVMNSPNVEVVGNTVVNNNDGIGGINADRDVPEGHPCPLELRDLYVHNNMVVMEEGHSGIADSLNADVFTEWNNRFENNSYELGSNSTYFRWSDGEVTGDEWLAAGNDANGTIRESGSSP